MTTAEAFGPRALNRRRSPRIPVAELDGAVSVVGARLINVSLYGMMIESPVALERESILSFRLVIGGEKTDVEARVVGCILGATGVRRRYGVGLEFTDIPHETRERLEHTLARLPVRLRSA
jgi:hypothetical protein